MKFFFLKFDSLGFNIFRYVLCVIGYLVCIKFDFFSNLKVFLVVIYEIFKFFILVYLEYFF